MFLKEGIDLYNAGRYEEAISFFNDYIKIGTRGKTIIYFYRGMCYFKLGCFKLVIKDLEFYLNSNSKDQKCSEAYIPLCISIKNTKRIQRCFFYNENPKKYFKFFEKAILLFPKNANLYYIYVKLIIIESCQVKYEHCINLISKAISLDKFNWMYYKWRGSLYAILGEYNKALEDFLHACKIFKDEDTKKIKKIYLYISRCYAQKSSPNFVLSAKYLSKVKHMDYFNPYHLKNRIFQRDITKW